MSFKPHKVTLVKVDCFPYFSKMRRIPILYFQLECDDYIHSAYIHLRTSMLNSNHKRLRIFHQKRMKKSYCVKNLTLKSKSDTKIFSNIIFSDNLAFISDLFLLLYLICFFLPPANENWGYICFTMSVRLSVCPSVNMMFK